MDSWHPAPCVCLVDGMAWRVQPAPHPCPLPYRYTFTCPSPRLVDSLSSSLALPAAVTDLYTPEDKAKDPFPPYSIDNPGQANITKEVRACVRACMRACVRACEKSDPCGG